MANIDGWKAGVDGADKSWDIYDVDIRLAVSEYERHLRLTSTGFPGIDWRLVKAMIWVETGPQSRDWTTRPIQIGNDGDPGLGALLNGKEGGDLIVPSIYRWTRGEVQTNPRANIQAGIGFLLMKMARFEIRSVPDSDLGLHSVTVRAGDSLDRIARSQGSTVETMRRLNPGATMLRPGQTLKYQKGAMKRVIAGWRPLDPSSIASNYNGGGDRTYGLKLTYAYQAVRKAATR